MKIRSLRLLAVGFLASVALFLSFSCYAQQKEEGQKPNEAKFYSFLVMYDVKSNSVKLGNDKRYPPIVGPVSYSKDTGSGSQFYAKLKDVSNKYVAFPGGSDRFYLGDWSGQMILVVDGVDKDGKPTQTTTKTEKSNIKASVPYSENGKTIELYDARTNKLALVIDASKFAQASPKEVVDIRPQLKDAVPTEKSVAAKTLGFVKEWSWVIIGILAVAIVGFVVYLIIRHRKKEVIELSNPQ